VKKMMRNLPDFRSGSAGQTPRSSDLSERETQDNVSMNNFKNNLTAFERQDGRGGNTPWQ
jgi:hypothetical protein